MRKHQIRIFTISQIARFCVCVGFLHTSFLAPVVTGQTTWSLSPGRSTVKFKVKHLLLMEVEGKFRQFEGTVVTRGDDFQLVSIEAYIPVKSVYTSNGDRDEHLRGEDFFYAERFPTMHYLSNSIEKDGDQYTIHGDLTIRGISQPVELKAQFLGQKTIAKGTCLNYSASGSINRFDFGLKWNEITEAGGALVSEIVNIELYVSLMQEVPSPVPAD